MEISRRTLLEGISAATGCTVAVSFFGNSLAAETDGVVRLPLYRSAGNLDPQNSLGLWAVQDMVFDPLVRYTRGGKLEPALAESWTSSQDNKIFTFKLRPNVFFTDGEPWNAESMKWNLERWITDTDSNWLRVNANFERLEIVDSATVALHLKESTPTALIELSYVRPVRFFSPKAIADDGTYKSPIGTGPWKVEKDSSDRTELVFNERYWGPKPQFTRVSLRVIPDARSRTAALRAGEIDAIGGSFVAPLSPQEAATLKTAGMTIVTDTGTDTTVLCFNPRRPLFEDQRLRKAISFLIDRDAICSVLLKGYARPTMNLYPEVIQNSGQRYDVPKRDVEQAKRLLEEAGWHGETLRMKDGKALDIELVISEDASPGSRALGEVLQQSFSEAGIRMRIRNVDHASRHDDIPAFHYDIALFVTNGAPYDPYNTLLQGFLTTTDAGTDGKLYESKELDPLIMAAISAPEESRQSAFQSVYDWLHSRDAIAPIYHRDRFWAHNDRIASFTIPATEYEMPLQGLALK